MGKILRNAIRTPDGTFLESRHRHDCVEYTDNNGKFYLVDGGLDYLRRCVHGDEEDLTVTLEDEFYKIRDTVTWGTYGINEDQPLRHVKLCDMDTTHIEAVLKIPNVYPQIKEAMLQELTYRDWIKSIGEVV